MAEKMKYVFGPVPSRRLGRSLGIDPIPLKTCNWNCVYCQLGRTSPPTNQRRDYAPQEEIIAEVRSTLARTPPGQIDWLTFVGSGEPTLHAGLGDMIRRLKSCSSIPLAVITNGSLLFQPEIRRALAQADLVMPSLDAGSERLYRMLDRPLPGLGFNRFVDGLVAFRRGFPGRLWIEVMLIQGRNDSAAALEDLAQVLERIGPDEVHLNLPVRPPAEPWVAAPAGDGLQRALAILGKVARLVQPTGVEVDLAPDEDVADAVLGMIARHPMSEDELVQSLTGSSAREVADVLGRLAASGKTHCVRRHGKSFWTDASGRYGAG